MYLYSVEANGGVSLAKDSSSSPQLSAVVVLHGQIIFQVQPMF